MNAKQRRVVRREAIWAADAMSASYQMLVHLYRSYGITPREQDLATGPGIAVVGDAHAVYVIARHRDGRQTVLHRSPPVAALPESE